MALFILPPYVPSFYPQGQFIHILSDLTLELKWFFFHPPLKKDIKGIVHPKMIIMSSFTQPQVVPNLYECLCSAEHKGRYSEECGKQRSSGAPLTSIMFSFLLWKSMVPQNSLITDFLQNIFLLYSAEQRHSYRFGTT